MVENVPTSISQTLAAWKRIGAGVGMSRDGHFLLDVVDLVRAAFEANIGVDGLEQKVDGIRARGMGYAGQSTSLADQGRF